MVEIAQRTQEIPDEDKDPVRQMLDSLDEALEETKPFGQLPLPVERALAISHLIARELEKTAEELEESKRTGVVISEALLEEKDAVIGAVDVIDRERQRTVDLKGIVAALIEAGGKYELTPGGIDKKASDEKVAHKAAHIQENLPRALAREDERWIDNDGNQRTAGTYRYQGNGKK